MTSKTIERLRVVGRSHPKTFERWNILEAKIKTSFGFRWVEIDREEVPTFVTIDLGCFGDTGGWKSKYNNMSAKFEDKPK